MRSGKTRTHFESLAKSSWQSRFYLFHRFRSSRRCTGTFQGRCVCCFQFWTLYRLQIGYQRCYLSSLVLLFQRVKNALRLIPDIMYLGPRLIHFIPWHTRNAERCYLSLPGSENLCKHNTGGLKVTQFSLLKIVMPFLTVDHCLLPSNNCSESPDRFRTFWMASTIAYHCTFLQWRVSGDLKGKLTSVLI